MTIKDKITALGAAHDLSPDAYLARALNRHGVAGVADRLKCSRSSLHQVCADFSIRWVYLSLPPDTVILVHPKVDAPYQTDGRLAKEDPPPASTGAGSARSEHIRIARQRTDICSEAKTAVSRDYAIDPESVIIQWRARAEAKSLRHRQLNPPETDTNCTAPTR